METERRRRRPPKKRFPLWGWLLIGVLAVILLVQAVWSIFLLSDEPVVELTIRGDTQISVSYGTEFKDPGATACWYGKYQNTEPNSLEVTVDNHVNMDKLGSYQIIYRAGYEGVVRTAVRVVQVVDTDAPIIELVQDPDAYTLVGDTYEEEGFTAVDNYDGDISDKVEREIQEDAVIYRVSDSSGNTTEVVRKIRYLEPEKPALKLNGEKEITITAGDAWKEPGYTATGFLGEDLTKAVKIEGKVDTQAAGTYTLTYSVTDERGYTTTAKRTVVVKKAPVQKPENPGTQNPQFPESTVTGEKVIYLTFDDGPGAYTPKLLDVLGKYNVKATFFVCKTAYPQYMKNIVDEGHSIAVHSLTHDYDTIYASEEAFFEDFYAMQNFIEEYTGVKPTLMRFPGGASNMVSKKVCEGIMTKLTQSVTELGLRYFDWNVDSNDAGGAKTATEVAMNVINGVKNRKFSVVLQHDIKGFSVDAVEMIIKWGLENGYTFKALTMDSPACQHKPNN